MLKRIVLTTAVVAAVTLTLGTGPAQGNQEGLGDADQRLLEAEAAAGRAVSATTGGSGRALQAVQDSIARWVERHGPRHTFASFTDPDSGRVVVETDAPTVVVRALTSVGGPGVEVRQATISHTVGDTAPFWGGIGLNNAAGAACTAGFTVRKPTDVRYLTTAAQVCTQTGCKAPVVRFQATTGSLPQAADSGGPFYLKSGSNVHVRGIVIASGGGSGYADKWSRISSQLGVSIVTV